MKIITWNCNGALRKKFTNLLDYNADIYIIQECENPEFSIDDNYKNWASNYLWIGDSKNKGLGIFASKKHLIEKLDWDYTYNNNSVKHFLPCRINNNINLLGVWTHKNNSPNFGYIGQFWKYLQLNKHLFSNIIIAGDFNSNTKWDEWNRWWNHSDVIKELKDIEIDSLYHSYNKVEQGSEHHATFYFHKKINRPYHIDYIFGSKSIINNINQFEIGDSKKWLILSDHVPILLDFN
jgi:exonuclease III